MKEKIQKISKAILFSSMALGFSIAYAAEFYCIKCDDIKCVKIICPPER
ncbi:hypothetical protein ACSLBF_14515 [Pseudoalteromonas sp. T1lg65]